MKGGSHYVSLCLYLLTALLLLTSWTKGEPEVSNNWDWDEEDDMDISDCLSKRQTLQDKRLNATASLTSLLAEVNAELSAATAAYASGTARRRAEVDAVNAEISEVNRKQHEMRLALERKMDCHFSEESLKHCTIFCTFPYAYDACQNFTSEQQTTRRNYVDALSRRMRTGDRLGVGTYTTGPQDSVKSCEIKAIMTMASLNLQYPSISR